MVIPERDAEAADKIIGILEFLEEVEKKLNERPRKRHGFLSPDAVFSRMTGLDGGKFV